MENTREIASGCMYDISQCYMGFMNEHSLCKKCKNNCKISVLAGYLACSDFRGEEKINGKFAYKVPCKQP